MESKLADEILHFGGPLHCCEGLCEVSAQKLTAWAGSVLALTKERDELKEDIADMDKMGWLCENNRLWAENKRLRERSQAYHSALAMLSGQSTPWMTVDTLTDDVAKIMAKYAQQVIDEQAEK